MIGGEPTERLVVGTDKLKALRAEKGLTLSQVAEYLGYKSPVGYWYIEKGLRRATAEHVAALASLFGVQIEALFRPEVTVLATSEEVLNERVPGTGV